MRSGPLVALVGLSGLAAALVWSEWLNRRWSRTLVGDAAGPTQAVVVLGFRNRGPEANVVNRWRVRAGLRSLDPAARTRLVLCGGPTASARPEARILADHAATLGYDGPVVLEEESRTTWENVARALPLVEDADRITFVSQPAHALKARAYVARQRPDLVGRLTRGADHRWGEWLPLKPVLAAYGLWTLRGVRPDLRRR
ncbi:YdcF family protein [Krasilnikoviella flava]|uniref:DUF218 domain-containing protein n=1 Tax=Krasilnikoviella flava TaxID=526729 RepID=A0A1T5LR84_9MICO|nr:YdcF family protein [Krasilnikoviella flava]SKC78422.1 DUF218 domain-containing protein [Krasilnikoviella flava]